MSAPAPKFTAKHVQGHDVSLRDYAGRKVVVVLTNKDSADQARTIARTVRGRFDHDALPIVSVADISGAPKMMQGMIRTMVKRGYKAAAEEYAADLTAAGRPEPADMAQALIMVTDGDGSIVSGFGLERLGDDAVAYLIDEHGMVVGSGTGADAGSQILALLG